MHFPGARRLLGACARTARMLQGNSSALPEQQLAGPLPAPSGDPHHVAQRQGEGHTHILPHCPQGWGSDAEAERWCSVERQLPPRRPMPRAPSVPTLAIQAV